jgi:hypothetical protein
MFHIVRTALIGVVAAFAAVAAAQGAAPPLLANAVSATQTAKIDYAFDFELDTSKQNWRARFNPRAMPRLTLLQPRPEQLKSDERRAFDRMAENMEGVSWCANENMGRVQDVRLIREDDASAVYAFQPTADSIRGGQARRFADRLRGEFTLIKATPDVSRIRLYTPAPFSPMPLVRVESVNVSIACQTAPNGRRYAAETITELRGSAFGQRFDERSVQRARNLTEP